MEAVIDFLTVSTGSGGYGYGSGGYGYGSGSGGYGYGGYGSGSGSGSGGYGAGGSGYGSGGSGYGSGGYGYGGYGAGGSGGSGYGSGRALTSYNGRDVYRIDDTPTLIDQVRGNVAKGHIVNSDMTLTPCWIVKQDNQFAHGATLREAQESLLEKLFDDMPEEERLAAFREAHVPGAVYPNTDFFAWHHRLTGSCEMGRRQFARNHEIDVEGGSMTVEDFIRLTEHDYGGSTIKKLREFYPMT